MGNIRAASTEVKSYYENREPETVEEFKTPDTVEEIVGALFSNGVRLRSVMPPSPDQIDRDQKLRARLNQILPDKTLRESYDMKSGRLMEISIGSQVFVNPQTLTPAPSPR